MLFSRESAQQTQALGVDPRPGAPRNETHLADAANFQVRFNIVTRKLKGVM